ncbi:helix-turn-helix domain-containing protein [Sphingomonas solaris]|uniref:Helix-turn-helix transcriptional regulator n=1 Tax=Alterirhizorhabdus solaris TaxID=2529389 RepID=A0A558RCQ5_9SPHN|nr:AraC family transcriptional regulator [Sphingomonas solaris]TVV77146.1 helix-turn-helix transcriptional regulator [Sphingomonas solaris]
MPISQVYDVPDTAALQCHVGGRIALSGATVELHHYRFRGPQSAVFRSDRAFVDLALSHRPGRPRGTYGEHGSLRPLGEVLFVPAGYALNTEWGEGEQTSICCAFDAGDDDIGAVALEAALDVRSPPVREALVRLAREIEQPGWCSALLAQSLCDQMTIEIGRYLRRSAGPAERATGLTPAQVRRIDDLIAMPGKLPGVAEMARLCDLSTRHFFRMFRAATGTTLADYAAARRLAQARAMLAAARPPVKEIAWRCGFETPAAFSAAFRKAMGVTPTQYRQSVLR